ncbi:MAG: hypothetical protein LUF78_01850 [Clostridiales bacterium]|nr:hypothetical protein [Clostridiales bacterium]
MKISVFSCTSSLIWATLLLSFMCLIRTKISFTKISEVKLFVLFYIFGFIRLLFPIDFTFFAGVLFKDAYSAIIAFLFYNKYRFIRIELSIGSVLIIFIFLISLVRIFLYVYNLHRDSRIFRGCEEYNPQQANRIFKQIREIYPGAKNCPILVYDSISVPITTGLRRKVILLPRTTYSDNELFYILLHEYTHIAKHDLHKKLFTDLFICVFWWIPYKKFLEKDIVQIIEIQCDQKVLKSIPSANKLDYMETLLTCLKRTRNISAGSSGGHLGFSIQEPHNAMVERFHIMQNEEKKPRMALRPAILGVLLFCFSYLYLPQANYEAPMKEDTSTSYTITPENSYLLRENDTYYYMSKKNKDIKVKLSTEHAAALINMGLNVKRK